MGSDKFWWGRSLSITILSLFLWNLPDKPSTAQMDIRPDNTLGTESSIPVVQGNNTLIEGGANHGINLFHSFEEFNINEGEAAYFTISDTAIENIFTRITGDDPSDILGTLGTCISSDCPNAKPSAALYFLNPNGILFGAQASLDVGGSFVATTANGIEFGESGVYGTAPAETNPNLLTVNPSAFLFNQSVAQPLNSIESNASLSIPENRSLLLVGGRLNPTDTSTGDIVIREGRLRAPGGQIAIGGLVDSGRIELNRENNNFSLSFPEDVTRSNFTMTGEVNGFAELDVTSGDGGNISIYARNINILNGSDVCSGIGSAGDCGNVSTDFGRTGSQGGNILFNASDVVTISGSGSLVVNDVYPEAIGNSSNVIIEAEAFHLGNGGELSVSTSGLGNAGKIIIDVTDNVLIQEEDSDVFIFNNVNTNAVGSSGGIEITTGALEVLQGAQVQSLVSGQGSSGGVTIQAEESILIDGRENGEISGAPSVIATGIFQNTDDQDAKSQGGNIDIVADSLTIGNRAQILSNTTGLGDAGDISITVEEDVVLQNSDIITEVTERSGNGQGGSIQISANSLELTDGSSLLADTENIGNAGNIDIDVRNAVILKGQGPGANNPSQTVPSQISTSVEQNAIGRGGEITITANLLSITNDGFVSSSTLGVGDSGNISIEASDIVIDGLDPDLRSRSNIITNVSTGAVGNGGNLSIVADSLSIENRAQIVSNTEGTGNAGNVSIRVEGNVLLRNSDIITEVTEGFGNGRGGDIQISAGSLELRDGSTLLADTESIGDAGNITISVDGAIALDGFGPSAANFNDEIPSQISSTIEILGMGRGGDITINGGSLQMTDDAFIYAFTSGRGDAGSIEIDVDSLTMTESADIRTSSFSGGNAGDIDISVRDRFSIDGNDSGLFSNTEDPLLEFESGNDAGSLLETAQEINSTGDSESFYRIAGNLSDENDVDIYRIFLEENSLFGADTINEITSRVDTDTRLFLFDTDGTGLYFNDDLNNEEYQSIIENIELSAGEYYLAVTSYQNEPFSGLGNIFDDDSSLTGLVGPNDTGGTAPLQGWTEEGQNRGSYVVDITGINGPILPGGNSGTITIQAGELSLTNGAEISTASSSGTGTAGEIALNIADTLYLSDGSITTEALNSSGGSIAVNDGESISGVLILEGDSDITTESAGNGGNITIRMPVVAFNDSDIIARSQNASGGNISLSALFSDIIPFDETAPLDGDGRVDINAEGEVSEGDIDITDTSFLQNELAELADSLENIDSLVLNSCVARGQENDGTISVSGGGNLQTQPGSNATVYSTGTVNSISNSISEGYSQQPDRTIVEPQAIYQLADGRLVMNRDCQS